MRGSHRRSKKGNRLFVLNLSALALTLLLALGQFGFAAAAGATDRGRDGSYSSDTEVVTKDGGGGSGGPSSNAGGVVASRPAKDAPAAPAPSNNITVCHATKSVNNPYNSNTVDVSSSGGQDKIFGPGGHASHVGTPPGTFFDPATSQNGDDWTDIIPAFFYPDPVIGPNFYPGLGLPQGQAILNAGCAVTSSLSVTKTMTTAPAAVVPGSTVTFSLVVANTGTTSLPNVTLTDTLPAGLTPQTATFNGNPCVTGIAGQTVTCNLGTIALGGSATVTVTALETGAPATCSYQNTASAISRNAAGGSVASDTSNTVTVNVQACLPAGTPDMSVLKSASSTVSPGGSITYTITAENLGNAAESNVVITDPLPAGTTFLSASIPGGWSAVTPAVGAGGTVTFSKASVAANESATFTIVVQVAAGATCGSVISNTATVSPGGSNAGNNSSTDTTNVVCANLVVSKNATVTVEQGGQITYTIDVQNGGTSAASNVSISDPLPAGTTFVSDITPVGWSASTPAVGANGTVTFTKATMAAGESAQFTIVVDVAITATCGGVISNTATGTTATAETNAADNASTDTTTVVCPNVSIVKSGGPTGTVAQGPAGVALTYTITINNTGAGTAPKTQIVDDLNDQLTSVVAVVNGAPPGAPSCAIGAGNVVTCGLFTLDAAGGANASASVTITATIPTNVCITVTNSASGTIHLGDANQSAIGPSNTLTTTTTGCGGGPGPGSPAISISKTANPPTVPSGGPVSYSITVTSFGTAPANSVTLTDTLPSIPGVTWSITSQPAGNPCSLAGNNLSCNFGTMNSPPQTTATVVVTSTNTTDASCGTYTNTATANAQGLGAVQASATATVQCAAVGGLDLSKTGPATAKVGDTVTYTFTVSLAPGSPDLTGVTISDPICDPGTLAGPTGDDGDNVLEAGETWGFSCTHLVTKSDPDPLPNTATACGIMPSGASVCDSDNHEIDIINPDIDVVKTADPTSGSPGDVITFTYTVTNSGDVPLTNVSVDDNVLGHICDIAVLPPHTTVTCTGTYTIPNNAPGTITNIVIAGGTDPAGDLVEAQDDFTITVVAGETVIPTKTPPGGLAFTGQATAIPIAALALVLLSAGTALLWIGRRRGRARTEGPQA